MSERLKTPNSMFVRPSYSVSAGEELPRMDILISSCGYEARSRYVAEEFGSAFTAMSCASFNDRHVLSYDDNIDFFSGCGITPASVSDADMAPWFLDQLAAVRESGDQENLSIAIDISSMSRTRLALVIESLLFLDLSCRTTVNFLYVPATYTDPVVPADISICGPVTPFFSGFSPMPGVGATLIVGLGYERHRALGVVEYLDPSAVIAFMPVGLDGRFDAEVESANQLLMSRPGGPPVTVQYRVENPYETFVMLESLLYRYEAARPTIVPMGPKLFALAGMLACAEHLPNAALWRVSAGISEDAEERHPLGQVILLPTEIVARGELPASLRRT
jgi:hypothetical protein